MSIPSVTYTLTNGAANDAGPVNTNFNDIIASLTDGTKTITIASVVSASATLTAATITTLTPATIAGNVNFTGAPTFAGNVTLGDAAADIATITGELRGARCIATLGSSDTITNVSFYIGVGYQTTTEQGLYMTRAGSVLGASFYIRTGAYTSTSNIVVRIRKNGSNLFSLTGKSLAAANTAYSDSTTTTRGTYTFSAGDIIEAYVDVTLSGNVVSYWNVCIELQFDT